jgi:hypothetical protein
MDINKGKKFIKTIKSMILNGINFMIQLLHHFRHAIKIWILHYQSQN